jgi:hypothetical protein
LLFNFVSEDAATSVYVNQEDLELSGTHQHLFYAHDDSILDGSTDTAQRSIGASLDASRETVLTICLCVVKAIEGKITI